MSSRGLFTAMLIALLSTTVAFQGANAVSVPFNVSTDGAGGTRLLVGFDTPSGNGTGREAFIHVVFQEAPVGGTFVDPTFRVEANGRLTGTVAIGGDTEISEDGGATEVAEVYVNDLTDPGPPANVAAGFRMVQVNIVYSNSYDLGAGETWSLEISNAEARECFGFAGSTVEEATQPRVGGIENIDFTKVQYSIDQKFAPVEAVNVRNIGTANLLIDGVSADPASDFLVEADILPTDVPKPGESLPEAWDDDNPNNNKGIHVLAMPSRLGSIAGELTISGGYRDTSVDLAVAGYNLYAHMLLDCSGSMDWEPDGTETNDEKKKRIYQAKQAGLQVYDWIYTFSNRNAYLGLSSFQGSSGRLDASIKEVWINEGPITGALASETEGGLIAGGSTPMQAGLIVARDDMDAGDDGLTQHQRDHLFRAILLLSDGYERKGNAREEITPLSDRDIKVFTVGYGIAGTLDVDHELLSELALGTLGKPLSADATDWAAVKMAFKQAISEWLNLNPVQDPEGTIRSGDTVSHAVCIEDDAYGITFTVDWNRSAAGGIALNLTTPTGQRITPQTEGVVYHEDETYAMYIIQGKYVRGGQGAGEWTMHLTGNNIPSNEDTRYSYSVLVQSPIKAEPLLPQIMVNEPILVEYNLAGLRDELFPRAVVSASYTAPSASFSTWLAKTPVKPEWVLSSPQFDSVYMLKAAGRQQRQVVPDTLLGEPATMAQRKAYALANFAKKPFIDSGSTGTLQFYDDGTHGDRKAGDRIFSNKSLTAQYDGVYKFRFDLSTPEAERRECVERDYVISRYLPVRLDSALIRGAVTWVDPDTGLFFDPVIARQMTQPPRDGFVRKAVVFTPKDVAGNCWSMGRADEVKFEIKNAEAVRPPVDNWDGSYIQVIDYRRGTTPSVTITAGGVTGPLVALDEDGIGWWLIIIIIIIIIVIIIIIIIVSKRKRP